MTTKNFEMADPLKALYVLADLKRHINSLDLAQKFGQTKVEHQTWVEIVNIGSRKGSESII